jgi:predicted AAA+ superfamily ATPase
VNVSEINDCLLHGRLDASGLFPHLESLDESPFRFQIDFGLAELPAQPGLLLIRGARQYGKSTWLEARLRATVETFGPGSAFYLNGDEIADAEQLAATIRALLPMFRRDAGVRRLFLDEITAVPDWERVLKRLLDAGELRRVLVVSTGSRATDLRRGAERLPGRKGRLQRTTYWFTPLPYAEFVRVCGKRLGADALPTYLLAGGCPIACAELAANGRLPEHVPAMVRDWVLGECSASGRDRGSLLAVLAAVLARGGTPIGQANLARAAGLANNTVAAGYVELLADLMCLGSAFAWDANQKVAIRRRPAKFPLINLLVATTFHPNRLRSVADFRSLPPEEQGRFHEWLVAQEIWRRTAIRGEELPEQLHYWQSATHGLDYVLAPDHFVEVKRGRTGAVEFGWFPRAFPGARLTVIGADRFDADRVRGMTLEQFLLEPAW